MPTIVIGQREDRTTPTAQVTYMDEQHRHRTAVYDRGTQYVVSDQILEILEQSYEAPYVQVLDRQSKEPTADELPNVEFPNEPSAEIKGKLGQLVETFGKAKEKTATPPA